MRWRSAAGTARSCGSCSRSTPATARSSPGRPARAASAARWCATSCSPASSGAFGSSSTSSRAVAGRQRLGLRRPGHARLRPRPQPRGLFHPGAPSRHNAARNGGPPAPNHKRVWRVRKEHDLLLQAPCRGRGASPRWSHRGCRAKPPWCSDGFEISCDNGRVFERLPAQRGPRGVLRQGGVFRPGPRRLKALRRRSAILEGQSRLLRDLVHRAGSHGLITDRPQSAKPLTSRVATIALAASAVDAIKASKPSMGLPARRRAATIPA